MFDNIINVLNHLSVQQLLYSAVEEITLFLVALGAWKGKSLLQYIRNDKLIFISKLAVSTFLFILVYIIRLVLHIENFNVVVLISLMSVIVILKFIWGLSLRASVFCSLITMSLLMSIDLINFMLYTINIVDSMIFPRIIHLIILIFILRLNIDDENPLIYIKWERLDDALKNKLSLVFSVLIISYLSHISIMNLTTNVAINVNAIAGEIVMLSLLDLALVAIAFSILLSKNEVNKQEGPKINHIYNIVDLNKVIHRFNEHSQYEIKYRIDNELIQLKNFDYINVFNYIIMLINLINDSIDINFIYTYKSLAVAINIEGSTELLNSLLTKKEYHINKEKITDVHNLSITECYDQNIDRIVIKIQKRSEENEKY
ncbi:hypothetical protein [Vallitalea okinawensis]|uniref:hypothetical protein n=1 Tax=Vallitalea okinawensis TaxID=2078660 RepID=UPI000CFBCB66|nr:hypothetical protein [Vallitalea okinawensis]